MGSLKRDQAYVNNNFEVNNISIITTKGGQSVKNLLQEAMLTKQYSTVLRLLNSIKNDKNLQQEFTSVFEQDDLTFWKIAIVNQDIKMVNMLLNVAHKYGIFYQKESILELAISSDNKNIVTALFKSHLGTSNDPSGRYKADAITMALKEGKFNTAEALLDIGKDISTCRYKGNIVIETVKAIVKELVDKNAISDAENEISYSLPKVKKGLEKELKTVKFLSLLLNKGVSIFANNDEGVSLADVLNKQDAKLKDLVNTFHTQSANTYEGNHSYLQKLIFSVQNYFSKPNENPYPLLHVTNDLIKSILPLQQKIAYCFYKLNHQNYQGNNLNSHGGIVDLDAETPEGRWKNANKNFVSKFLSRPADYKELKERIEHVNDLRVDALKCIEISCAGVDEAVAEVA